jgi:hypothetical protein
MQAFAHLTGTWHGKQGGEALFNRTRRVITMRIRCDYNADTAQNFQGISYFQEQMKIGVQMRTATPARGRVSPLKFITGFLHSILSPLKFILRFLISNHPVSHSTFHNFMNPLLHFTRFTGPALRAILPASVTGYVNFLFCNFILYVILGSLSSLTGSISHVFSSVFHRFAHASGGFSCSTRLQKGVIMVYEES